MRASFPGQPQPIRIGWACLTCQQRIYLMQAANGDTLWITHDGKKYCQ